MEYELYVSDEPMRTEPPVLLFSTPERRDARAACLLLLESGRVFPTIQKRDQEEGWRVGVSADNVRQRFTSLLDALQATLLIDKLMSSITDYTKIVQMASAAVTDRTHRQPIIKMIGAQALDDVLLTEPENINEILGICLRHNVRIKL